MPMALLREQLAEAEHQVGLIAAHVAWQAGLIAELRRDGHPMADAISRLRQACCELEVQREHRDWLQAEIGAGLAGHGL